MSDNGQDGKVTKKLLTKHFSVEGMRIKDWQETLQVMSESDISMLQLAPDGQDLMESDLGETEV